MASSSAETFPAAASQTVGGSSFFLNGPWASFSFVCGPSVFWAFSWFLYALGFGLVIVFGLFFNIILEKKKSKLVFRL